MPKRVVVTGIGVVAPNGLGKEAFWQALTKGLSGVRPIRRFDPSLMDTQIAGEVTNLDPFAYFEPHEVKKMDRSNIFAVAASTMAFQDAGLDLARENPERIGSSIGNAVCGIEYAQKESDVLYGKGSRWGSPYLAIAFFPCGSNGQLSIRFNMKGPVLTFSNGNTSGTDAIGMAYRLIRNGKADIMMAGGIEAPLIPLCIGSLARDGWLSKRNDSPEKASRPFDRSADGMVLSEGAGILILEELAHAKARGARIYAEIKGYASANSAFDVFHPEPNGMGIVRTMKMALQEAQVPLTQVDWVNAQGFSIPVYDQMESRCMQEVFSPVQHRPRISAVSSWIGNPIGALGGIQAALSALALEHQTFPPQDNLENPDPDYPLRWMDRHPEVGSVDVVIQNSYCFMGKNSSLVFRRAT